MILDDEKACDRFVKFDVPFKKRLNDGTIKDILVKDVRKCMFVFDLRVIMIEIRNLLAIPRLCSDLTGKMSRNSPDLHRFITGIQKKLVFSSPIANQRATINYDFKKILCLWKYSTELCETRIKNIVLSA